MIVRLAAPSLALAFVALAGCKNPADDVPAAAVTQPTSQPAASEGSAADRPVAGAGEGNAAADDFVGGTATLDPENTTIGFEASKVTATHHGGFEEFSGSLTTGPSGVVGGSVEISLRMETIFADRDRLTRHLRSDDFFDAPNFQEGWFRSTSITEADVPGTYTVAGRLTLKGVAQDITFPAKITVAAGRVNADAEFSIDRQLWGVSYRGAPDDLIRDEVVIRFSVDAPLQ